MPTAKSRLVVFTGLLTFIGTLTSSIPAWAQAFPVPPFMPGDNLDDDGDGIPDNDPLNGVDDDNDGIIDNDPVGKLLFRDDLDVDGDGMSDGVSGAAARVVSGGGGQGEQRLDYFLTVQGQGSGSPAFDWTDNFAVVSAIPNNPPGNYLWSVEVDGSINVQVGGTGASAEVDWTGSIPELGALATEIETVGGGLAGTFPISKSVSGQSPFGGGIINLKGADALITTVHLPENYTGSVTINLVGSYGGDFVTLTGVPALRPVGRMGLMVLIGVCGALGLALRRVKRIAAG